VPEPVGVPVPVLWDALAGTVDAGPLAVSVVDGLDDWLAVGVGVGDLVVGDGEVVPEGVDFVGVGEPGFVVRDFDGVGVVPPPPVPLVRLGPVEGDVVGRGGVGSSVVP
jgi:hypothetical protein